MRWAVCVLAIAGCYSGKAQPGAPCTPALDNCPGGQTCQLVGGEYICVEGASADARVDDATGGDDASDDAATLTDAGSDGPPPGPWTLVSTRSAMNDSVLIPATGAGHLIVVAVQTEGNGAVTAVSDNGGNTYTAIAGSRAVAENDGLVIELWYAKNSVAGATRIGAMANIVHSVTHWEVAGISTTSPFDKVAHVDNQAASTTPVSPNLTTAANGEFVVAIAIISNTTTGTTLGNPFTNDHTTFGNGWAHLTSATAPAGSYQAQWSQPNSGVYCATAAAFFAGP